MSIDTSQRLTERDFDRSLMRWVMRCVGDPRISIRLWDGVEFTVTDERPVACMEVRQRRAVFELLRSPSVGFGECYSKGLIEVHGDLRDFANEITRALTSKREDNYYRHKLQSMLYAMRVNSLTRSRHNVHHHYDLGNDFYKLWLDERMVYTCAYFEPRPWTRPRSPSSNTFAAN
jgi:cyclopropane-fatty-acyl-phospholipid synthase